MVTRTSRPFVQYQDDVNVLICTNEKFLQHAAVCLVSLLQNNSDLYFNICVAHLGGELISLTKLIRSVEACKNAKIKIESLEEAKVHDLPLNPRAKYTSDIWTRLWVDTFFDNTVSRVLYLDCDVVVVGSIKALWTVDLEGALLAAVDIPDSTRGVENLGLEKEDGYFNSGVLLIDLIQWRSTKALNEVLEYIKANFERLRDPDQDALNACFSKRWKRLDYKWNATTPFFYENPHFFIPETKLHIIRKEARIIHFNGWLKPWSYVCNHPRKGEYNKYLQLTEWRGYVPPDRTIRNRLVALAKYVLPRKLQRVLKSIIWDRRATS